MNTTATRPPSLLLALAPAIAAALPGQWTARDAHAGQDYNRGDHYALTRADGLTLSLSANVYGHKGRIVVRHDAPSGKDRRTPDVYPATGSGRVNVWPEITVADSKTPEQIAADIVRRLLTDAETARALVLAKIAANEACEDATAAAVRKVAKAAGQTADPYEGRASHDRDRIPPIRLNPSDNWDRGYGDATVNNGGATVRIDLQSIPTDKALALVAWLRANVFADTGASA